MLLAFVLGADAALALVAAALADAAGAALDPAGRDDPFEDFDDVTTR